MKISQIKKQSRKIIKGNVKSSLKFPVLFVAGIILFSALPYLVDCYFGWNSGIVLGILAAILLLGCVGFASFRIGSKAWFVFYNRKKRNAKSIYWLKPSKAAGCTGLYFSLLLRKIMWTLSFLSPGALIIAAAVIIAMSGGVEFNLFATWIAGGALLLIMGICFLYFFLQRYFLVPYVKAMNPSMKNREIIAKSREYMADCITKTAMLKISFLPWFAVSVTVIPICYVWAYYSQSLALMACEICRKQKNTDSAA